MVITKSHPQFIKSYKTRISHNNKLIKRVSQRLKLFQENPGNPLLKDHQLSGEKSHLRAFWVSGNIRIIYLPSNDNEAILIDIGSHNQVY